MGHALVESVTILDCLAVLVFVNYFVFFADEGAVCLDYCFEHAMIVDRFSISQTVQLNLGEFLLTGDQLEHAV